MRQLKAFTTELLSIISRLLNVLTGGIADMTLSARAHMDHLPIEKHVDTLAFILTGERNHCERWYHYDVGRACQLLEAHAQRSRAPRTTDPCPVSQN